MAVTPVWLVIEFIAVALAAAEASAALEVAPVVEREADTKKEVAQAAWTDVLDVEAGATVIIMGLGGVGIAAVQGARLAGASVILASDPVAERREIVDGSEGLVTRRVRRVVGHEFGQRLRFWPI